MFKTSQHIDLNVKGEITPPTTISTINVFGKYQKTTDADSSTNSTISQVFISPELTDTTCVQLLHFPNGAVHLNEVVTFFIKRNGIKGNFEVKLENPLGQLSSIPLKLIDSERLEVRLKINEIGLYKVHIKCNSVLLTQSPFIIIAITGGGKSESESNDKSFKSKYFRDFKSDATKVIQRGLKNVSLRENSNGKIPEYEEFIVDASQAGNNILFVGICGPHGQCEEVIIKHMGQHMYKVRYCLDDIGDYILAVKWGDNHIPGSPFTITAL